MHNDLRICFNSCLKLIPAFVCFAFFFFFFFKVLNFNFWFWTLDYLDYSAQSGVWMIKISTLKTKLDLEQYVQLSFGLLCDLFSLCQA